MHSCTLARRYVLQAVREGHPERNGRPLCYADRAVDVLAELVCFWVPFGQ
jgi:hypothetical protein